MKADVAIKVDGVTKSFILPHEKSGSIKNALLSIFSKKRGYEVQHVLQDISFEIKKGEFFGIVGRNGSGKSTLLKMLAGIYTPDKGSITVNGKLTPFIELGVGFNPELSGRDNVFLNGALLGFSRQEMEAMYDQIVDFAELERFMDQKLKNYSSGMQVRLAFSIAIRANTEILVLDEVLAVGDAAFQQKCFDYFATLKKNKKTVILVSHSMSSVERFCDKALLIDKGTIPKIGSSSDVAFLYENLFISDSNERAKVEKDKPLNAEQKLFDVDIAILQNGTEVNAVEARKPFGVKIRIIPIGPQKNLNVGVNIRNSEDVIVFSTDMRRSHSLISLEAKQAAEVIFTIENRYTNGKYFVDIALVNEKSVSDKLLYKEKDIASFDVMGIREHVHSMFHPNFDISVNIDDI